MLTSIELKNFRGFKNHKINFRESSIIVGSNNAGKSTLVEAFRMLSLITNRYKGLIYKTPPQWSGFGSTPRGVSPSLKHSDINLENICHKYNNSNPAEILAIFSNGAEVNIFASEEGLFSTIKNSKGRLISTRPNADESILPTIGILPQIGPLQKNEKLLSIDYVKENLGSYLSSLHFRNQINISKRYYRDFKLQVEKSWNGVRLDSFTFMDDILDAGKGFLSLFVQNDDFVAEVGHMGHGLQMWLQIIWFLVLNKDKDIIILDEPDVYMHADLQRRLSRLIRKRFKQTIITTHSIEIISEVDASEILVINKSKPISKYADSSLVVQEIVNSTGSIQNISIARLWSSKKVIIVEGNDIKFLKLFQDKLYPNSTSPFDIIPSISVDGWGGWQRVIGINRLIKNQFGEAVNVFCIFDSDYHTKHEINERMSESEKNGIITFIWSRKEIENYFINVGVISRLIKKHINDNSIELKDIKSEIESKLCLICKNEEDNLFDSICDDYRKTNYKNPSENNRQARLAIKNEKSINGSIVNLLSGKKVISELSNWAKAKYGYSFGAFTIIKEMIESEIPTELRKVIEAIEKG